MSDSADMESIEGVFAFGPVAVDTLLLAQGDLAAS